MSDNEYSEYEWDNIDVDVLLEIEEIERKYFAREEREWKNKDDNKPTTPSKEGKGKGKKKNPSDDSSSTTDEDQPDENSEIADGLENKHVSEANRKKITHMYETVLNHTFKGKLLKKSEAKDQNDFGKWNRAQTTHLVYTIDGDDPIIITNISGDDKGNHAEEQLIEILKKVFVTDKIKDIQLNKTNKKSKDVKKNIDYIHKQFPLLSTSS